MARKRPRTDSVKSDRERLIDIGTDQWGRSFGGKYLPMEIVYMIVEALPFEDRANVAAVCGRFRAIALPLVSKLKVMKDLPFCAPAPDSWLKHRTGAPSRNMSRLQTTIARCSSQLTYLNLLGTNIVNQDLMSWIYRIDLPRLEILKFPNGTDLYINLLRDLAYSSKEKWPRLNQISIGFGSKLEVPEECLDLVIAMRQHRPALKSNIARCRECQTLYFTDSRVKCEICGNSICTQHFTRASGNHCPLSLRQKCPYSELKFHSRCADDHLRWGCATRRKDGSRYPCYTAPPSGSESSGIGDYYE